MISSQEICERAGCTYRQLDWWDRQRVIGPVRRANGNGTRRGWGAHQIATIALITELAALGATHDILRTVAQRTEAWELEQWTGTVFVDPRGRISTMRGAAACWSVNLEHYGRIAAAGQLELSLPG